MKSLLVAAVLTVLTLSVGCGSRKPEGATPPAPNASEAPKASTTPSKKSGDGKETDVKLPKTLDIQVPSVPEGLQGPPEGEKK
jgi:hypothetical protein